MSGLKTVENNASVTDYLAGVTPAIRHDDAIELCALMQRITDCEPRMWGASIVGFDHYDYTQKSGRPGHWPITGFWPQKSRLSIYIMPGFSAYGDLMKQLGTFRTGACCLYVTRLSNIDRATLETLVKRSVGDMRARHRQNQLSD